MYSNSFYFSEFVLISLSVTKPCCFPTEETQQHISLILCNAEMRRYIYIISYVAHYKVPSKQLKSLICGQFGVLIRLLPAHTYWVQG